MEKTGKDDILLEVRNLKKYFPVNDGILSREKRFVKAVDDVSFTVDRGETIGIVGESGCGKSTLGQTILQLQPLAGHVVQAQLHLQQVIAKGNASTHGHVHIFIYIVEQGFGSLERFHLLLQGYHLPKVLMGRLLHLVL